MKWKKEKKVEEKKISYHDPEIRRITSFELMWDSSIHGLMHLFSSLEQDEWTPSLRNTRSTHNRT
ncbi:Protein of unknown function [Gryllus bimaculatus]|nr:Protein of unknown function [Gryllus bimaculatus]